MGLNCWTAVKYNERIAHARYKAISKKSRNPDVELIEYKLKIYQIIPLQF